jgi:hypothetical protein
LIPSLDLEKCELDGLGVDEEEVDSDVSIGFVAGG